MDNSSESNPINKNTTLFKNLKKGPKLLYNTTIGELKNGRIPILDSAYRTVYRKSYNPNNSKGKHVFQKSEGYYRLGGKYGSRRKRKNKTRITKRNKMIKNKSRKNKKQK
jgi:hypothetical protein